MRISTEAHGANNTPNNTPFSVLRSSVVNKIRNKRQQSRNNSRGNRTRYIFTELWYLSGTFGVRKGREAVSLQPT